MPLVDRRGLLEIARLFRRVLPGPPLPLSFTVGRLLRSYRRRTCGFELFLASFAFQSICSPNIFRLRRLLCQTNKHPLLRKPTFLGWS